VTARAEQLELDEVVTSTADERDPVVDFQLLGGAAPDADAIACVVAVLVTADTRPKDLSRVLDEAFEDWDAVLQFVVEGYGWPDDADRSDALGGACGGHCRATWRRLGH
jgi:hypothetical protein